MVKRKGNLQRVLEEKRKCMIWNMDIMNVINEGVGFMFIVSDDDFCLIYEF